MALADFLSSPNTEQVLAAIPQIFGSYEEARGRPLGAAIGTLGGLLGQHAAYRQTGRSADVMQKYLQGIIRPGSMAGTEFNQFQPVESQFDPSTRLAMLQNILSEAQSEANKKPTSYYNKNTGQWENHDPLEFPNGVVPANLIPPGPTANKLADLKLGIGGSDQISQESLDAFAQAGYKQSYKDLIKTNPKAAVEVYNNFKSAGAQNRADISRQNYELERQDKLSDSITKMTVSSENAMNRLAASNAMLINRLITLPGEKLMDSKTAHNYLDPTGKHLAGPASMNSATNAGYKYFSDDEMRAIENARGAYTALNAAQDGLNLLSTTRLGSYGNAELANIKGDPRVVKLLQANLAMLSVASNYSKTLRINANEMAVFNSLRITKSDTVASAKEKMTQLKNQLGSKLSSIGADPDAIQKDVGAKSGAVSDEAITKMIKGGTP